MIKLSLALAYLQHAIKRQSENRHYLINKGFTFLHAYYDIRQVSHVVSERQEGEFNVARAYHMLGLTHLAVPYYERCIAYRRFDGNLCSNQEESFSQEASIALQHIWATNGEASKATYITCRYLLI